MVDESLEDRAVAQLRDFETFDFKACDRATLKRCAFLLAWGSSPRFF